MKESKGIRLWRDPRKLIDIQASPLPRSTGVHPKKQKVRQKCQEIFMDEQGASGKIKTQKYVGCESRDRRPVKDIEMPSKQTRHKKAKDQAELNLVRGVKGNKKAFCSYVSHKRRTRENVSLLLLKVAGALVTQDIKKAEVLNAFFTSVSSRKICLQQSKDLEIEGKFEARNTYMRWKRMRLQNT